MKGIIVAYRSLIFCILLFLEISRGYSQDSIRHKRTYIGPLLSPDYSSAILKTFSQDPYYAADNALNKKLHAKMSFTTGIDILCQYTQHLSLSIGIQYSVKDGMTENGILYSTTTVGGWWRADVAYLDLPVKLDYYFGSHSVRPYLSLGISPNVFLYYDEVLNSPSSPVLIDLGLTRDLAKGFQPNDFYHINPQAQLGAGLDADRKKKGRFRIELVFRYSILPANPVPDALLWSGHDLESDCARKFYSVGLALSYLCDEEPGR